MPERAITISVIEQLPEDIESLACASELEGFRFLRRLIEDWQCGDNRFDQAGEVLFGVWQAAQLVGIGGLNCDCDNAQLGRIRRVYLTPEVRHHGVGRALLQKLEAHAQGRFRHLVIYTNALPAMQFYEDLGYRRIHGHPQRSHEKFLRP